MQVASGMIFSEKFRNIRNIRRILSGRNFPRFRSGRNFLLKNLLFCLQNGGFIQVLFTFWNIFLCQFNKM